MKDDKLEKEFDEYFKGVSCSNDITADAKKSVKPKRRIMPKFAKFASIAASFVLVFAVALTIILKNDFKNKSSDKEMSGGNDMSQAPSSGNNADSKPGTRPDEPDGDNSSGEVDSFKYYTDADLTQTTVSSENISSLSPSLKFIEQFGNAENASVRTCKAGYIGEKLALVTAEVDIKIGIYSDKTDIFVEFTDTHTVYRELADYYNGQIHYDNGTKYYLTKNGEESKLVILYGKVKYYFNIRSDDENAYAKYLQWIKL